MNFFGKARVAFDVLKPNFPFMGQKRIHTRGRLVCRIGVAQIYSQRPAMRGELLNVEYSEMVPSREAINREKRKIREVLVVDGVELVLRNKSFKVRKLQRNDPLRCEKMGHSSRKIVEIGNLRQDVISDDEISAPAL